MKAYTRSRGLKIDSFMRPELIVFVTKAIEPSLLLNQVGGRRTRRLGFQDTINPLVLPVLLLLTNAN